HSDIFFSPATASTYLAPLSLHDALPISYRSCFQRDRDRITHCAAFRRLSHKTQVFTGDLGDYHRSRLTHTLEVASIASGGSPPRSEEHTSELQSRENLVCRLLLEKKKHQ